jgi:hypothetical protein
MTTWSWSMPGAPDDARAVRERLNEIGEACGYSARRAETKRGPLALAAGGYLIRALAEGQAAALPISPEDRAWLAYELLELAVAQPERTEAIRRMVAALGVADAMSERGQIGAVGA